MSAAVRRHIIVFALACMPLTLAAQSADNGQIDEKARKEIEKENRKRAEFVRDSLKDERKERERLGPTEIVVAALPRSERVTLWVPDFDYASVQRENAVGDLAGLAAVLGGAAGSSSESKNLGAGLAALFKAELVRGESYRVLEPLPGTTVPPKARFMVKGAITELGQEKKKGGLLGGLSKGIAGVAKEGRKTTVGVTLTIMDAETGELLLTESGLGVSGKGGGLVIGGAGGGVGGVGGTATSAETAAIAEAIAAAAKDAAARLVNRRDELIALAKELE